jgi:hypothetical protein
MASFDQTPDRPEPFGYKIFWFALKAPDAAAVLDALGLGEGTPANWSSGLAAVYGQPSAAERWLFVSPPVDGWRLAISTSWPYPTVMARPDIGTRFDAFFAGLMARFDDVQFFGSHRVTGFVTWARALNGKAVRKFAYADGQVLINFGDQTPEEHELGLVDLSGLGPHEAGDAIFRAAGEEEEAEERLLAEGLSLEEARARLDEAGRSPFPGEEDVVDLAALWSIDPTKLADRDHEPALGLAARLPNDWRP